MKRRTIIYVIMLFVAVSTVNAQSVTYIHENDIMNQFLTMETGAGALTPAAYYNTFHKSYQRDANVRNKLIYRTSVMAAANEEKAPAEKIDSDYVARELGVGFILKYSKTLLLELSDYISDEFLFGDFVFRNLETGEVIGRARHANSSKQ
jgi:hypothetical protein